MMSRISTGSRRLSYAFTAVLSATLLASGAAASPANAAEAGGWQRDDLRRDEPVSVTALEPDGHRLVDPSADQAWDPGAIAATRPEPGTATFVLGGASPQAHAGPGELPISVSAPSQHPAMQVLPRTAGSVTVEVLDAAAAEAAGVAGVLVAVSGSGTGPVDLLIDYTGFADLYGGSWGSRLDVVELPACAVATPWAADCLHPHPVSSRNDTGRRTLTTRLDLASRGLVDLPASPAPAEPVTRVFAVMADPSSGGAGDYRATDLSMAGSWASGGNDGAFTYGYPLRVPPAAGPLPQVALAYSSASHDGRTSGRNNQASWVGDGWAYEPGFIERYYRPCSLDDQGSNNNPEQTGDLCWDGNGTNVTISLKGTNGSLVRDDASGEWRAAEDSNWRIERLGSPASSASATSERWKVTTTDGTQYFFASEVASSGSRWTVPVFGNHPGEPCREATFKNSSCRQAYRWMLDKVIDTHGNMVRFFYSTETGNYGAAGEPGNRVAFHRGGRLTRIEYGLHTGAAAVAATGRVLFETEHRCLSNCGTLSNPAEDRWPDTPWDLHCAQAPCTSQLSPVFFNSQRLTTVTTQVRQDATGYRTVDSWALEHEFKDYGDEEQVTLWLKSIRQTGQVGGTITLPGIEFDGEALPNRVDAAAGVPVMWRWRLSSITTETGAVITITYDNPQCTVGSLPSRHANSLRCYPVRWTPEFHTEPIEDWFHKHVVASVIETDTTGGMPAVETYYEYATSGGGTSVLWAFDDSEFTDDEHRTYNQWRGYAQVTTRLGDPAEPQTRTRARFYRGLDGQPLPSGGTRTVNLSDEEGNTVRDHEALAGRVWENLTYNGSAIIVGDTFEYWTRRTATRSRDHDGGDLRAWLTGVSAERTRSLLTSTRWQRTETHSSFDTQGRLVRVDDRGDAAKTGDEYCSRIEYADNNAAWIKDAVTRVETVAVRCGVTPSRPNDVDSDLLFFYDGKNTHGASPTAGTVTRTDELDDWRSGPVYVTTNKVSFDSLGREVSTTDALGRTTTVAHTPAGPGPKTREVATNPLGHRTTTEYEPAWGVPSAEVDPNGRRTTIAYDALGRSASVWLPGRDQQTQTANLRFEYRVRRDAPSAVVTMTLNHLQEYVTSVVLYDALLRERQVQSETADHGRLVDETVYDTHGRVDEEFGPNHNTDPPGTTIVRVREEDSARRIAYRYDAAGRVTDEILYNKHVERWRTVTRYGGSSDGFMITVRPPEGAPAEATITGARGEVIGQRTYHTNQPTGPFDLLTYEYSPTGAVELMRDPVGNEWTWRRDLRGRVVEAVDPDTGTTTTVYDAAGQELSITDARGETLAHEYDVLGREVARRDGDGNLLAEWEHDTAINGIGMPGRAIRWLDGAAYVNETRTVNSQGLVTQTSVTIPGAEGRLAGQYWFTQSYYPNGQVMFQGFDPAGDVEGGILQRTYDHVGNPTSLVFDGDSTGITVIVDDATFTPFDEVQTRRLGASDFRQAWHGFVYEEGTRRLERTTFDRQASGHAVADMRYTYDDAGNIRSIADLPEERPGDYELQCLQYDHLRRLTEAWTQGDTTACAATPSLAQLGGPAPYWNTYQHDAAGNRTAETLRVPGAQPVSRSYSYPAAEGPQPHTVRQVTTAGSSDQQVFDYDAAGNTTTRDLNGNLQSLRWDAEGKLASVSDSDGDTRMVYDADGNRIIRDDGDQVTAFLPQTEITWDRPADTLDGARYFTHADQVVAICTGQDVADWVWLAANHQGTTTHAVNAFTGVVEVRRMDPYGNPRGAEPGSWPGQQSFVGGTEDPTGLLHIGARAYDPDTGRFLSADVIIVMADDQQINGYAYANNSPVSLSDPSGLCAWDGYNLCPGMDVRQQPTFTDKCRSYSCGVSTGAAGPRSGGASGGGQNEALDYFFGPPPPGHVRADFETDAMAPGNGVIIFRFFISDETFYFIGEGDGRDFSVEVEAGYRVVIAWDTDTGRISYTASPSCTAVIGCQGPLAIGEGNDIEIIDSGEGTVAFSFSAGNAATRVPAIDQEVRVHIGSSGNVGVRINGDSYPDFESVAYRGNDAVFLGRSSHSSPGGPGVWLPNAAPRRDIAFVEGRVAYIDGQSVDEMRPSSPLCLHNPLIPGC